MNFSSSKQIFLRFYAYMYLYTGGVVKKGIKHFPDSTGGSRGRAQGPPPPLFLDQNEAKRAEKYFWRPPPPPPPPQPSSLCGGLDAPMDSICNI